MISYRSTAQVSKGTGLLPSSFDETNTTPAVDSNYRNGVINTLLSVGAAVVFGLATYTLRGQKLGLEFFAGYLVEQSLSVDNLFVFVLLFEYFKVPVQYQDRVLKWGIIGALVMRGIMILVGVAAVQKFHWIILIFAAILLLSAIKLLFQNENAEDLENNSIMIFASTPCVTNRNDKGSVTQELRNRFARMNANIHGWLSILS
eukprot:gene12035-25222_t